MKPGVLGHRIVERGEEGLAGGDFCRRETMEADDPLGLSLFVPAIALLV